VVDGSSSNCLCVASVAGAVGRISSAPAGRAASSCLSEQPEREEKPEIHKM